MSRDLPTGWRLLQVQEIGHVQLGRQRAPKYQTGKYSTPYLRAANITWNGLKLDDVLEMDFDEKDRQRYTLEPGDILLSEGSGSATEVGKPAVWKGEIPGCCIQNTLIRLRPDQTQATSNYLVALLRHYALSGVFVENSRGVGIHHIGAKAFEELRIPVPPLDQQRRIVAKIEDLTARSRKAREALEAIPPLIEKFKQSVLAAAFRGDLTREWREKHPDVEPASELLKRIRIERRRKWEEAELAKMKAKGKVPKDDRWKEKYKEPEPVDTEGLPELPEGWVWLSLEQATWDAGYGTSEKCLDDGCGPPVLRIPNVTGGRIDLNRLKYLSRVASTDDIELQRVAAGDLLVVRTNGSQDLIGRGAVATSLPDSPLLFASYLIRLRLVPLLNLPSWVAAIWAAPQHRRMIEASAATSAGQYNVSLSSLLRIALPLPPASEQTTIVGHVADCLGRISNMEEIITTASPRVFQVDQSILAKAFQGELVPQDPNDISEPVGSQRRR